MKSCRSKEQWTVCTRAYLGVSWRHVHLPVISSEPDIIDNNEKSELPADNNENSELPNSDTSKQLNNSNNGKDFIQYYHI